MAESLMARLDELNWRETGGGQWFTRKPDRVGRMMLFDDLMREYRAAAEIMRRLDHVMSPHVVFGEVVEWLKRNGVKRDT